MYILNITNLTPYVTKNTMKEDLFICLQYIIPQALTSRLVSKLAESKNKMLKNYLINLAVKEICDKY